MKRYYGKIVAMFFLAAIMVFPALAVKAENGVRRDPFAPPDMERRRTISAVVVEPVKSSDEVVLEEAATLELRATIRSGDWSMANINGTMVEQGGEIDGFTLLSISQVEAVLRKEGIEVILVMKSGYSPPAQ